MTSELTLSKPDVVPRAGGRQRPVLTSQQMRSMVEDIIRVAGLASDGLQALERDVDESRSQVRRAHDEIKRNTDDRHAELRTLHKHLQGLRGRLQQQLNEARESRALAKAWEERAEAAQQRISGLEQELADLRHKAQEALIRAWILETRMSEVRLTKPET